MNTNEQKYNKNYILSQYWKKYNFWIILVIILIVVLLFIILFGLLFYCEDSYETYDMILTNTTPKQPDFKHNSNMRYLKVE